MLPILHCPPGVTFDPVAHAYRIDGVPAPSVSGLLSVLQPDLYAGIAEDVMQRAATRGTNCHSMIALDVRDVLDYTSLDEEQADHYLAFERFKDDTGFMPEHSELVVCSRRFHYCGTLDLSCTLVYKRRRRRLLLDVKNTAAIPKAVGVQTAGYQVALAETLPDYHIDGRAVLHIKGDRYQLKMLDDRADPAVFQSCRTIHNWRANNG